MEGMQGFNNSNTPIIQELLGNIKFLIELLINHIK